MPTYWHRSGNCEKTFAIGQGACRMTRSRAMTSVFSHFCIAGKNGLLYIGTQYNAAAIYLRFS